MAVRLTKSNGEIPAIPAATTITAVIGEMVRNALAIKCIGKIMRAAETPVDAAMDGTKLAKAKNGAFPEPITMEEMPMMDTITRVMPIPPKPDVFSPVDEGIDGTDSHEAFGKEFAGYDKADYVCHLATHAVEVNL